MFSATSWFAGQVATLVVLDIIYPAVRQAVGLHCFALQLTITQHMLQSRVRTSVLLQLDYIISTHFYVTQITVKIKY